MAVLDKISMTFNSKGLSKPLLKEMHLNLLRPRLIEEKMLILLRQGKISKWFSGIGQEAISVGVAMAMDEDEFMLPMHRNLGVFTTRNVPLERLFAQFQGKALGFTQGRDRSFHFGSMEHHVVGMISHLGPQLGIADGIALGHKLKKTGKSTIVFTGDGGASEGDFHESLNVAAVWDLPVIFVVENNCWGLSTPSAEQFRCKQFIDKGIGYGIDTVQVDGNNIIEVYNAVAKIRADQGKNPKPVLLECMSFRMRGHEEASGTKYYPEGIQDEWALKDPLDNFQMFLLEEGVITENDVDQLKISIKKEINDSLEIAYAEPDIEVDTDKERANLFVPFDFKLSEPETDKKSDKRLIDAVSDGLGQSMERYDNLVIMGQDIAEYGGVFKVTEGFVDRFGKDRVRNTPICESAIVGAALGLSMNGFKAVMEMQFADFATCGFNQIVNNLAKLHWRWGENADVVVRMPTGAGVGAGPFHSQSNEAWFFHTPGLKIVYPAFPGEAKGLLAAAIEDPNPVMYFEHKALYRSISEEVSDDYYTTEIGKASMVKTGSDVSIITYGMGVHWALDFLKENPEVSADVVNLRTLLPLDQDSIFKSVQKTGRVIVLHEDCITGGIGGELSALIAEHCFEYLDAPVIRSASLDTPVPFAGKLEDNFLPKERFASQLLALLNY
ncbi:MAG: 2-oxoisovalerate dehydrogenase E1 component [Parvicellaceae bacterium]|jgi:2-oxoisovalerate dehydrogenase E1 component